MQSLPSGQADQLLKALKGNTDNGGLFFAVIRGNIEFLTQPSEITPAAGTTGQSSVSLELCVQHPAAYPFLIPIDAMSMHKSSFDRLIETQGGSTAMAL